MRVAFTIVLNGKRHLEHNNFWQKMVKMFDWWVIVEGVSLPTGSTSWCKELPGTMHKNYLSNDGTTELLDSISKLNSNIIVVRNNNAPFDNKDSQVNAAITRLQERVNGQCFLWQVDVDEQWTIESIEQAENMLITNGGKTGCFLCNYYVGDKQKVIGEWGEGRHLPYRRLWDWKGETFKTHEPPTLEGKNGPGLLLPQRFEHFAYYFEEDVKFKEAYYQGYEGLHSRWLKVQENKSTMDVSALLGNNTWWSKTQTFIIYEGNAC